MRPRFLSLFTVFYLLFVSVSDAVYRCDAEHKRFLCKNGQCISELQRCDFQKDCLDDSDELGCNYPACDNSTKFTCDNKKCIHIDWKCDGTDDCFDGSDEKKALCLQHKCTSEQFKCVDSPECLPVSYKCDGDVDCNGGEDESGCKVECGSDEFQCSDNSKCVSNDSKCDGVDDCTDGSDEEDCVGVICKDNEFACESGDQCLQGDWKCDGIRDCKDGSDEKDCPSTSRCANNYFPCATGSVCIPKDWVCDGNPDCSDGSEELNCDNLKSRCPFGDRLCTNRRQCISKKKWCDGSRDCIDHSDEMECPPERPTSDCAHETHFRCPGNDSKCILSSRLCDGFTDCPGGEDEKKGPHLCSFDECQIQNGTNGHNCSHICRNLRLRYECDCPAGLRIGEDKITCEDIDECASMSDPCDSHCFNTVGSYKCACDEGYTLVRGRHCKPTNSSYDMELLVGERSRIEKITLDRHPVMRPLLTGVNVDSIAVDIKNDFFYWSDVRSETISRAKISNPSSTEVILDKSFVKSPRCLAVDWLHGLLFWSDTDYSTISVVSLSDLEHPKTLYRPSDGMIISIAVHPVYGYIYMGSSQETGSDSGLIKRCGMDGDEASCVDIVTERISFPTDIAIDYDRSLLYWVDNILNILVVSDLDGNNRLDVRIETHSPMSLAVFSGKVYFTDTRHHQLLSTNRTGGELKVVDKKLSSRMDIAVLKQASQKYSPNACQDHSCDMLCLPKSSSGNRTQAGYLCVCPDGFTKLSNSCIENHQNTSPKTKPSTTTTTTRKTSKTTQKTTVATEKTTANSTEAITSAQTGATSLGSSPHTIIIIGAIALILLIVGILWFVVRRRRRNSTRKSMNFNNPIYKKANRSIASSSSFPGLTDPSPTTSSGDVSNHDDEGTAALVLNEELPDGSDPDLTPEIVTGVRFTTEGKYTKISNGHTEIEFPAYQIER